MEEEGFVRREVLVTCVVKQPAGLAKTNFTLSLIWTCLAKIPKQMIDMWPRLLPDNASFNAQRLTSHSMLHEDGVIIWAASLRRDNMYENSLAVPCHTMPFHPCRLCLLSL